MKNKIVAGFGSGVLVFAVIGFAYLFDYLLVVAMATITAIVIVGFFVFMFWIINTFLDGEL